MFLSISIQCDPKGIICCMLHELSCLILHCKKSADSPSGQPLLRICASKRLWLSLRDLSAKSRAEHWGLNRISMETTKRLQILRRTLLDTFPSPLVPIRNMIQDSYDCPPLTTLEKTNLVCHSLPSQPHDGPVFK